MPGARPNTEPRRPTANSILNDPAHCQNRPPLGTSCAYRGARPLHRVPPCSSWLTCQVSLTSCTSLRSLPPRFAVPLPRAAPAPAPAIWRCRRPPFDVRGKRRRAAERGIHYSCVATSSPECRAPPRRQRGLDPRSDRQPACASCRYMAFNGTRRPEGEPRQPRARREVRPDSTRTPRSTRFGGAADPHRHRGYRHCA